MCGLCGKVGLLLPRLLDNVEGVRLDPVAQVVEQVLGDAHDAVHVVRHHFGLKVVYGVTRVL